MWSQGSDEPSWQNSVPYQRRDPPREGIRIRKQPYRLPIRCGSRPRCRRKRNLHLHHGIRAHVPDPPGARRGIPWCCQTTWTRGGGRPSARQRQVDVRRTAWLRTVAGRAGVDAPLAARLESCGHRSCYGRSRAIRDRQGSGLDSTSPSGEAGEFRYPRASCRFGARRSGVPSPDLRATTRHSTWAVCGNMSNASTGSSV